MMLVKMIARIRVCVYIISYCSVHTYRCTAHTMSCLVWFVSLFCVLQACLIVNVFILGIVV